MVRQDNAEIFHKLRWNYVYCCLHLYCTINYLLLVKSNSIFLSIVANTHLSAQCLFACCWLSPDINTVFIIYALSSMHVIKLLGSFLLCDSKTISWIIYEYHFFNPIVIVYTFKWNIKNLCIFIIFRDIHICSWNTAKLRLFRSDLASILFNISKLWLHIMLWLYMHNILDQPQYLLSNANVTCITCSQACSCRLYDTKTKLDRRWDKQ